MKYFKASILSLVFPTLIGISACSSKTEPIQESFPENFGSYDDAAKVAYIMKICSPDSVARFICDASLGKVEAAKIDTFAIANAYAYENYTDSNLQVYSKEMDDYSANLPLPEKMTIYFMAGRTDPHRLGYQLGLEYVNHIRESRMTVEQIKEELEAFKNACAEDSATYHRFMKGFQTVLKLDHGKDLPEEIYETFIIKS